MYIPFWKAQGVQLVRKYGDPHFYFMIAIRTVSPLNKKKSMFSFLTILPINDS